MVELTLQTWITGIAGLILGGAVAYIKARYKGQKDMANCVNERLDLISERLDKIETGQLRQQQRDIISTYRFYKSRKKIPLYEMKALEDIYKEYSVYDSNGIILEFMKNMRAWTTSEEDKG